MSVPSAVYSLCSALLRFGPPAPSASSARRLLFPTRDVPSSHKHTGEWCFLAVRSVGEAGLVECARHEHSIRHAKHHHGVGHLHWDRLPQKVQRLARYRRSRSRCGQELEHARFSSPKTWTHHVFGDQSQPRAALLSADKIRTPASVEPARSARSRTKRLTQELYVSVGMTNQE